MIDLEEYYPIFFDNVPFSVLLVDLDGTIIHSNTMTEKVSGFAKDDLIGKNFADLAVYPSKSLSFLMQRYNALLKGTPLDPIEIQVYKKKGSLIWLNLHISRIQLKNKTIFQVISEDIDKRKKAEQKVAESEEQFRTIAEQSLIGIGIVQNGKFVYLNEAFSKICGYSETELMGWTTAEQYNNVHPEDRPFVIDQFRTKLQRKIDEHLHLIYRIFTKSREVKWLEGYFKLIDYQESIAVLMVINDITERKQAEDALKKSEEKYRVLIETMTEGLVVQDAQGIITYVNPKIGELLEYSPQELIGSYWKLFVDEDAIRNLAPQFAKRRKGEASSYEMAFRTKTGREIDVKMSGKPMLDAEGNYQGALAVVTDITTHKQAEEKLRESEYTLRERIKELTCLFNLSQLTETPNATPDDILQGALALIPPAYQFPEITCVRIMFADKEYKTHNFQETQWKQSTTVKMNSKDLQIDVCYLGDKPFLKEEEDLIRDIGNRLRSFLEQKQTEEERKRAELALRESEMKYSNLVERANDGILIVQDEIYTYANPAMAEISGYSVEEIIGMPFLNLVAPESKAIIAQRNKLRFAGEKVPPVYEVQIQCKDGTIKDVELSAGIIQYQGKAANMGIIRDITERKRAEEALQESEEKYRILFESSIDSIIFTNMEGGILNVNQAYLDMLGYSKEEIRKVTYQELTPHKWHDMERERVQNQIIARGYSDEYEKEYFKKDGTIFPISIRVWLIMDQEGKPTGMWGIVRDITERKRAETALLESEEKFRTIAEQSLIGIAILQNEKFIYLNGAISQISGYSTTELQGWTAAEYVENIHPEDRNLVTAQLIKQFFTRTDESLHSTYRIFTKTREVRWLNTYFKVIKYQRKPVMLMLVNDITDNKRAEEAQRKAYEELKELDRMKDEFYADLSHELRTPLVSIKGFGELLLNSTNLDVIQRQDLETILRNEQRLEKLVIELMEFSRLKSGKALFKQDRFRVSDILYDLTRELEAEILEKQIVFSEKFEPDEELIFDKYQITKVIKNFLSNAIKFSLPRGEILIKSTIEAGLWTFAIQDHGIGIAEEDVPKIFTRFLRLKRAESRAEGGIGLGLAIAKKIIDHYGGKIWVESNGLNKGATFYFQLKIQ